MTVIRVSASDLSEKEREDFLEQVAVLASNVTGRPRGDLAVCFHECCCDQPRH